VRLETPRRPGCILLSFKACASHIIIDVVSSTTSNKNKIPEMKTKGEGEKGERGGERWGEKGERREGEGEKGE
jgi:hypothetical protein